MTFVQDVSSDQQQGKSDKKCVLKITKAMDIILTLPHFYEL